MSSNDTDDPGRITLDQQVVSNENGKPSSLELAMRNTALAYQRTRISADRTLMSVIRTSLSLMGFGFTIAGFFRSLHVAGTVTDSAFHAARNFGIALLSAGILLLILGLYFHVRFIGELRRERKQLVERSLVFSGMSYPISLTTIMRSSSLSSAQQPC